jgi:uncharacterized SAM-binding protein YcdF (DUF218 family)
MKPLLQLMLFPGLIFLLLGVGLWLLWRLKSRYAWGVLISAFVIGWIGCTQIFGRTLSTVLLSQVEGPALPDPQATDLIIVLTGGATYTGETGWLPTQESYRRAIVAYELQSRVGSRVPVLISGGHTSGVRYPSEADVLKNFFDRRNAQLTPTLVEDSSTNTYESSLQVAAIARKRQADTVFLVTSEVHMLRALAAFRARGVDAVPFPTIMLPRGNLGLQGVLPTWQGARLTTRALYEIYGIVGYLLTGKITLNDLTYGE